MTAAAYKAPTVDERIRILAARILTHHDKAPDHTTADHVALGEAIAGLLSIGLGTRNALAVEAVLCRIAQALGIDPDKEG